MRAIRLYVDQSLTLNAELELAGTARHYAVNVLRVHKNSSLILFNGRGYDYPCEILAITKKTVAVRITGQLKVTNESPLRTHLLLGVSKGSRMDYAIQKTVEAGVTNVHPIITQRTVVKSATKLNTNKRRHWQRIIINACEQCARAQLPTLHDAMHLARLETLNRDEHGFVFDIHADQTLAGFSQGTYRSVWLLVGPEGGLTSSEIDLATARGYQAATFGARVLRTETAALAALLAAQLLWGDCTAIREPGK